MTVIFKDFDIETLGQKIINNKICANVFKFMKSNKIVVRIVSLALIGILSVLISILSVGITFGVNVKYSNKVIATVHNASVFDNAKSIILKNINGSGAYEAISSPEFNLTLTVADKLVNADNLAEAIIENTEGIVYGSALIVNDETIACVEAQSLADELEAKRTAYFIRGAKNNAQFVDDVKVENGYYLKSDIKDISVANEIINSLKVKTVSTLTTDVSVAYTVRQVKTNSKPQGYSQVTTAGKYGKTRKTEEIVTLNGEENSRTVLSQQELSAPVEKVITIGTAPVKISATERANVSSAGFICPLSVGKYKVSAYYGDGRNHKGVDLSANKGVAIFAAASGVVTYAGYKGDYGYNVVIDHGNGFKTRYAHASALCVSSGDTVSQGDMIAAVGSTGYSTGNHLHFEVIVNGTRVNPAPYIGLK